MSSMSAMSVCACVADIEDIGDKRYFVSVRCCEEKRR